MKYLKDIGFVIKRVNFGESDRYITLYTKEHGKMEVVAKGVRKITSRRSSHIEPLNIITFQAIKGYKNYILTEVELVKATDALKTDLKSCAALFMMCELIDTLCPYDEKNTALFHAVLQKLQEKSIDEAAIHAFQIDILTHLGYWDAKKAFRDGQDIQQFIENITERKMKTPQIFNL